MPPACGIFMSPTCSIASTSGPRQPPQPSPPAPAMTPRPMAWWALRRSIPTATSTRVRVCDADASGKLQDQRDYPLCQQYPGGNYKPTGVIQKYSDQLRLAAFG